MATVGHFASYCRCVGSEHVSNGKRKGAGNTKNGNKYLSWAFIEAAHFAIRYETVIRTYYQRKRAQTHPLVALKAVAHKLARACYHMLREQVPFDLADCIEEALQLVAPKVAGSDIELTYALSDGTPTMIAGDPARLRQVLVNLLANSIKFTSAGEVGVSVSARPLEGAQHEIRFAVRDTGIGIPRDRFDRLFKSFSQIDVSTTRRYGGTGLGLVLSRRFCQMMGGDITVESEPGRGTAFTIQLPREVQASETGSLPAPPAAATATVAG